MFDAYYIFYSIISFSIQSMTVCAKIVSYIIFAWLLPAAMMEADIGSNCSKMEKMRHLPVPPGFASLTSFSLKRGEKVRETNNSTTLPTASEQEPNPTETNPEMNDIAAYNQIYTHRPWILLDQSNHIPEKSHTQHLPMDPPLNSSRPKGTIRGCPNCSNCMKVTARWHPEDARREVLEEAPIFHPTEEEFQDTLKYIASIRSRAEPYGICRIVPPTCWKPPCFLEKKYVWENSKFVAQVQRIDGHQVPNAPEIMVSSHDNAEAKRRRGLKVAVDSHLCNKSTCPPNNQNIKDRDCEPERGPKFSLKIFKKFADEFKIQYFNYQDKNKIIGSDINLAIRQQKWQPSVENIEGEYGRIAQNPTEEIEVLCGNTLEVGDFSSGFPTVSDPLDAYTYPEYLKSGWNVNNIHSLPGSLLSFERSEAARNFAPRIRVGMCFSPLNWKVEEHQLYSLCYMHLGEPRVWYSVPGRFLVNFETTWKKYLRDMCAGQPDRHDNLVMQLSCSILMAEGIPVYRCVQYPREFVLVFPGAYHSGFDCGFNCSEAVSFAPLEWLLHGQNVVELYCERKRKTLISYDKLLLGAAREAVRARWEINICMKSTPDNITCRDAYQRNGILVKALSSRIRSESSKRKFLCASLKSQKMDRNFDACKRECSTCLCDLYLSAVSCLCSDDKFACLDHAKQLCSCPWSDKIVIYRYEISELDVLHQALDGKLSAVYKWAKEDLGLTVHSVTSKRSRDSRQTTENVNDSENLMKEPISPSVRDAYLKWKHRKLQATSNASEGKQNEVASQVKGTSSGIQCSSHGIHSEKKTTLLPSAKSNEIKAKRGSATTSISGENNSAGTNTTIGDKFTISKKLGDPTVSSNPSSRFLSLLQENMLFEVSSDSTSSSSSSESDEA